MNIITHYDKLIDDNNDPFHDPQPLKEYMDKWDGQLFIDSMHLTSTKKVLEIGIGTGRIAAKVAPFCLKLSGIDISPKTINRAKENLSDFNNIEFICADFSDYIFAETFDVIYSSLSLMHFENKRHFIFRVSELLNRNGTFCLSVDKNSNDSIDMGDYKLKIYPDKIDDLKEYIVLSNMYISSQFETEFAHILICSK
ncbi:MAG: class I SAM-dependent methyltransferase [Lachnospiraceae bacterium]|nr:class I SAM-dependent methyltransferase [Lachnospiraceae bacterium]